MAKNIILVGESGTGKSSVAPLLAHLLGYGVVDTDAGIVREQQQKIAALFLRHGEEHFRELEVKMLDELSGVKHCVIATGGGLPCHSDNWLKLAHMGVTVHLTATPRVICQRLLSDRERLKDSPLLSPALEGSSDEEILLKLMDRVEKTRAVRSDFFAKADITIDSGGSTVEFCALMVKSAIAQRRDAGR